MRWSRSRSQILRLFRTCNTCAYNREVTKRVRGGIEDCSVQKKRHKYEEPCGLCSFGAQTDSGPLCRCILLRFACENSVCSRCHLLQADDYAVLEFVVLQIE